VWRPLSYIYFLVYAIGFLPWMRRIKMRIIAITRRMWMNPPIVYAVTTPSNQRIRRITAIVISIEIK
jgi:hypothetical protein